MTKIASISARGVVVPMARPLATGGGTVDKVPLALVDLACDDGTIGRAYVFTYTPAALKPTVALIANMGEWLKGDVPAPHDLERKLQARLRLLGAQGLTLMALAGIDMAAWDAAAKRAKLPLAKLLGGSCRPIPAYNSCGLGIIGADRAGPEARELANGFSAIKLRLGYATLAEDIAVARAVREAVGPGIQVMTDYNQCLSVPDAIARAHALDGEGIAWIEEPTAQDDWAGHARVAREARTAVQLGENWWGPRDMAKSIAADASDLVMPDAVKIGGVSGWLRAAALAEAAGLPMSSHLYPEVSAHLLAVTPTAHWLEYVDWANPILATPIAVRDGRVAAPDVPGIGIDWNEASVARFAA